MNLYFKILLLISSPSPYVLFSLLGHVFLFNILRWCLIMWLRMRFKVSHENICLVRFKSSFILVGLTKNWGYTRGRTRARYLDFANSSSPYFLKATDNTHPKEKKKPLEYQISQNLNNSSNKLEQKYLAIFSWSVRFFISLTKN